MHSIVNENKYKNACQMLASERFLASVQYSSHREFSKLTHLVIRVKYNLPVK